MKMEPTDLYELKLDEADEAAASSDVRFDAEDVFSRVRKRIKQQCAENPL